MSIRYPTKHAINLIKMHCEYKWVEQTEQKWGFKPSRKGYAVDSRFWNQMIRLRNKIAEVDAKNRSTLSEEDVYNEYGNYLHSRTHTVRETIDSIMNHIALQGGWDQSKNAVYQEWVKYIDGFVGSDSEYQIAAIQFFDRYLVL